MCLAVWATPLLSGVVLGTVVALFGILRYMCGIHTPLSDVTLLNWYLVLFSTACANGARSEDMCDELP